MSVAIVLLLAGTASMGQMPTETVAEYRERLELERIERVAIRKEQSRQDAIARTARIKVWEERERRLRHKRNEIERNVIKDRFYGIEPVEPTYRPQQIQPQPQPVSYELGSSVEFEYIFVCSFASDPSMSFNIFPMDGFIDYPDRTNEVKVGYKGMQPDKTTTSTTENVLVIRNFYSINGVDEQTTTIKYTKDDRYILEHSSTKERKLHIGTCYTI